MDFANVDDQITFFVNNEINRQAVSYLAEVAESHNFDVAFTNDNYERAEIGIYPAPQTVPYVNANLSIAMFHGIDSSFAERYWPQHDWSQFDMGLLPSQAAAATWRKASTVPHSRPKYGMYVVGWPKSDYVFTEAFSEEVKKYQEEYKIADGKTIMYAPLAESKGKIDEFVSIAEPFCDSLLIKHGSLDGGYALPDGTTLEDVYEPYRNDPDIHILDCDDSIYPGLELADILISDQSSPLTDAAVTSTVPISVLNWPRRDEKIPDQKDEIPEFVIRTNSWSLDNTLSHIYQNYEEYTEKLENQRTQYYYALGESSELVVRFIEQVLRSELLPVEPVYPMEVNRLQYQLELMKLKIERMFFYPRFALESNLSKAQRQTIKKYGGERLVEYFEKIFKFR